MGIDYGRNNMMVTAAHRYCLSRQSYIVSDCVDWLLDIWHELDANIKDRIIKETKEALEHNVLESIDRAEWQRLIDEVPNDEPYHNNLVRNLSRQVAEGQEWAVEAYLHAHPNLDLEDLEIVQLQGNPFAYYVRALPKDWLKDTKNVRLDATEVWKGPRLSVNRVEN